MNLKRREFIIGGAALPLALFSARAIAQETPKESAPPKPGSEPARGAPQDGKLVQEFVGAGHRNLPRVKELLAIDPKLVFASWDWGRGDWETALGGASHIGSRDIARYLLSQGARIDAFCAAMLADRNATLALLAAHPATATTKGPHNFTLLYHVAVGGDVAIAQAIQPLLPAGTPDYNQALHAAAREGHLPMTKWLLENGVTDPSTRDAFKKTPLMTAREKKFREVAGELERHGATADL
ncbi:MAG TPA: ankyrin repeat domain-containing protein [Opitutaceae bacterium]|nr:ankyrin repeat domain-containing protein [Opitutaceae bacterium]